MEPLPHSHDYREDKITSLVFQIQEKLKDCPAPNQALIGKMAASWLMQQTTLSKRTRLEYAEVITDRLVHQLKITH